MQVFATRVWGFSPHTWPVIVFNREADRNSLLNRAKAGDCIIFVATQGDEPRPEDRGRILGMAEIGPTAVNTLEVVRREDMSPRDFDEARQCRWPKAVLMVRAWLFPSKPLLKDVLSRQLPRHATSQAVPLSEEDARVIQSLTAEPVELPDSKVLRREREFADELAFAGKPTLGPRPTDWKGMVSHTAEGLACTYVLRFGKRDIWKIGWADDLKARLADVNKHIPSEVTGEKWLPVFSQSRPSREAAFKMEQRLLQLLTKHRTEGERVRCLEKDILTAWSAAFRG